MPWWIWLILALFMLAMIVAGIAYAALHGFRALNGIAEIGGRLGKPLSELADVPQGADAREPPLRHSPNRSTAPSAGMTMRRCLMPEREARTSSACVGAVVTLQPLTDCGPRNRFMHAGE